MYINGTMAKKMGRPVREGEKKDANVTVKTTSAFKAVLEEISARDRRTLSNLSEALLIRGYIAYLRDGKIFEPDEAADAGWLKVQYGETVNGEQERIKKKKMA